MGMTRFLITFLVVRPSSNIQVASSCQYQSINYSQLSFSAGSMMASVYNSDDIFWGQLGGAMEAVDSGTTTVVDFAHMLYSPEHGKKPPFVILWVLRAC